MKNNWIRLTAFVMVVALSPFGYTQGPGSGAKRGPGPRGPAYDASTEITLKGSVEDVIQATGRMNFSGTHLTLKAESGTFDVRLGPSSYLAAQKFELAKGDQIEVTGSKVKFGSQEVILAREVKKGDKTLTLRDANGIPQWSRGRRRQAQ